jgi:hypothetical protein
VTTKPLSEARKAYLRERYARLCAEDPEALKEVRRGQYTRTGREYFAKRRETHPEERKSAQARYREKYPDRLRNAYLKKQYGITVEQYEEMLAAQGGACAICGRTEDGIHPRTGKPRRLAVDHCHDTGRVRGLLCLACNSAIGLLRHDEEVLLLALEYLRRFR